MPNYFHLLHIGTWFSFFPPKWKTSIFLCLSQNGFNAFSSQNYNLVLNSGLKLWMKFAFHEVMLLLFLFCFPYVFFSKGVLSYKDHLDLSHNNIRLHCSIIIKLLLKHLFNSLKLGRLDLFTDRSNPLWIQLHINYMLVLQSWHYKAYFFKLKRFLEPSKTGKILLDSIYIHSCQFGQTCSLTSRLKLGSHGLMFKLDMNKLWAEWLMGDFVSNTRAGEVFQIQIQTWSSNLCMMKKNPLIPRLNRTQCLKK